MPPESHRPRKAQYRLIIVDDETLEKLQSLRFSKRWGMIAALAALLLIIGLTTAAIFFTPIKTVVPGYADYGQSLEFLQMRRELDKLSAALSAQGRYITQVQQLISGSPSSYESLEGIDSAGVGGYEALGVLEPSPVHDTDRLDSSRPQVDPLSLLYFYTPVKGTISAGYLHETDHLGIDIVAAEGTTIHSILDGYIIVADWTLETGHTLGIQHDDGLVSFYKHNSALLAKVGDRVKAGEAIAIIGNSGTRTDGPHLHFELWRQGKPVNPEEYLDF